jgi:hypothetical protein
MIRALERRQMVFRRLAVGIAAAGILIYTGSVSRAEENYLAAMIRELPQASVSLDQALKASEGEGNPISAEYDVEDGGLQISVYAKKGIRKKGPTSSAK